MRRALAVIALAALSVMSLVVTAPADAGTVTNNGLTISALDQYVKDGCHYYPIHYGVVGSYPEGWSLDVDVEKPGSVGDFDFKSSFWDPSTGDVRAFLCLGLDEPGTWSVTATLTDYSGAPDTTVHTTFRWKPASSAVTVGARPTITKTGGYVTFSGRATYNNGATHNLSRALITIQYQLRGATTWKTFANVRTGTTGLYSARLKFPFRTSARFRAKVNAGETYNASYSKSVYVTRVR